jgi:16S rRNA (adenine1518-N6/adenine1519-N6)-dimethyltransferase
VIRPVSRNVFFPVPNVDSVLVRLQRHGPAATPEVRKLVQAGFAHRRKALAGSLALAGRSREQVREALEAMGRRPDARAEVLAPAEWADLAARLGGPAGPAGAGGPA